MQTNVNHCLFKELQALAYCNDNNAIRLFGGGWFPEWKEKHQHVKQEGKSLYGGECSQINKNTTLCDNEIDQKLSIDFFFSFS